MAAAQCPVCGSNALTDHPASDELLVCGGCAETLEPHELVGEASDETRLAYARANQSARAQDFPWSDPGAYLPRITG